ncbi:MAG: endonuclease domain-containing protein [Chitinophagales bacterium]
MKRTPFRGQGAKRLKDSDMSNMFYGAAKPIFQRAEELRKKPTQEELLLWQHLKANQLGVRFKRQHPIWMYIADFYCHELKLVIEVDGSIHNLEEIKENDKLREEDIASFGIKIIRTTIMKLKQI